MENGARLTFYNIYVYLLDKNVFNALRNFKINKVLYLKLRWHNDSEIGLLESDKPPPGDSEYHLATMTPTASQDGWSGVSGGKR